MMGEVRYRVSVISPTVLLIGTIIALNLLPGLYIYIFEFQEGLYISTSPELYTTATELYLQATFIFLIVFCASRYCVFTGGEWRSIRSNEIEWLRVEFARRRSEFLRLPIVLAVIGTACIWIYFAMGGYEKILSYGSDLDSWEFRMIGYDDRPRVLIAALEAARRVLLPYAALYFVAVRSLGIRFPIAIIIFVLLSHLVGGLVTLDRAPILLFFIMLVYVRLCRAGRAADLLRIAIAIVLLVIGLAGVTTFIQYNLEGFSPWDVMQTGMNFLVHRTIVVPSIASIELSFHLFPVGSEKLLMAYSRLTALFGNPYVGSQEDLSVYVTPVGAVADIWRNFGYIGVISVAFFLGWYFRRLDDLLRRCSPVMWIVGSFNVLSLCFYYIFGVFFSQGVFLQMVTVYCLLLAEAHVYRRRRASPSSVL